MLLIAECKRKEEKNLIAGCGNCAYSECQKETLQSSIHHFFRWSNEQYIPFPLRLLVVIELPMCKSKKYSGRIIFHPQKRTHSRSFFKMIMGEKSIVH